LSNSINLQFPLSDWILACLFLSINISFCNVAFYSVLYPFRPWSHFFAVANCLNCAFDDLICFIHEDNHRVERHLYPFCICSLFPTNSDPNKSPPPKQPSSSKNSNHLKLHFLIFFIFFGFFSFKYSTPA
jgi:hypothetical protein